MVGGGGGGASLVEPDSPVGQPLRLKFFRIRIDMQQKKVGQPFQAPFNCLTNKGDLLPRSGGYRKWLGGRREHKGRAGGCTWVHSHACILALHPVILPLPYLASSHLLRLPACILHFSLRSPLPTSPPPLSPACVCVYACARARKDTCLCACRRLPQINGSHFQTLWLRSRTYAESRETG